VVRNPGTGAQAECLLPFSLAAPLSLSGEDRIWPVDKRWLSSYFTLHLADLADESLRGGHSAC